LQAQNGIGFGEELSGSLGKPLTRIEVVKVAEKLVEFAQIISQHGFAFSFEFANQHNEST
jgi:hypothetical protein